MQKGNIGVTTENIFPIIKNSYTVTMRFSSANWCQTQ